MSRTTLGTACGMACMLAVTILACDDTAIDPFENAGQIYTVYGFLNDRAQTHSIRVIPITRQFENIESPLSPQAIFDGHVTTTDLMTGTVLRWTHSLEQLSDGSYGHIFSAGMLVLPNRRYRLEVTRSDGKIASAETTVPSLANAIVERSEPYTRDDSLRVDLRLVDVSSPWNISIVYSLYPSVLLPHGRVGRRDGDDWIIEVNVDADIDRLAARFGIAREEVRFDAMGVNASILDDQWTPPGDAFDPEVLAQPDAFTNVTNGYGFFGSIGLMQVDWPISASLRAAIENR